MPFDRKLFFDTVRHNPFPDALTQAQVDGMNALLDYWEIQWAEMNPDLRWLGYILATSDWETAHTHQPIEEYGKGQGQPYGVEDPETHQTYYGRGFVQLTWRDNYARSTKELGLKGNDDLEWHAQRALDLEIAASVIFEGMAAGWFTGKKLDDYFNDTENDAKNARQIVNGNDHDEDIAELHDAYLAALQASYIPETEGVVIDIAVPDGIPITVRINGMPVGPPLGSRTRRA